MESDRWNSPDTCVVSVELLGHQLQFSQDPNSKHHGTTVWDASLVLVKFLEKNSRKGRFSPSKLKGKRVIELGAGCGVAGFGMALLGCDVVATDQAEVIPLLKRNVERNTSRILQTSPESFGSIQVTQLDWGNEDQVKAVHPPFDYIIGTDIVYVLQLLEPLLWTMTALSGPKTTILLGYEVRSTGVHQQMIDLWRENFDFKTIPISKMHHKYQHPSIQLFIMGPKPAGKPVEETTQKTDDLDERVDENKEAGFLVDDAKGESSGVVDLQVGGDKKAGCPPEGDAKRECSILEKLKHGDLSEWEARRYGSIAARLLRDVHIK